MISVVVPVYNSENSLTELTERIYSTLSGNHDFEILYIDDGSLDSSWKTIEKLVSTYPKITGLKLGRNFGQHNALLCGIRQAKGSTIVTLDDDLQHSPEDIPLLLEKLSQGFDVVYASPKQPAHSFARTFASKLTKYALQKTMGNEIVAQTSAFRAFNSEVRFAFENYNEPLVNIDVLLSWATTRFASIIVNHDARQYGSSGYTIFSLIRHALNMMTGFSTRPLKFASMIGILFSLVGIALLIFVLIRWVIEGSIVQGFAFIASAVCMFSGAQLVALGIIGEYISRIHLRTMKKPSYIIKDRL